MSALKTEIVRLSRKEAKAATNPLRKPLIAGRKAVADLKRRVASLEKDNRRLAAVLAKVPQPVAAPATASGARLTGRGMRKLRRHLDLSAAALGKLVNVTKYSVYDWEKHNDLLRLRPTTRAAILSIRHLGVREAKARLQALAKK
jgi:DNA-binding transcriptional regulator YiaG